MVHAQGPDEESVLELYQHPAFTLDRDELAGSLGEAKSWMQRLNLHPTQPAQETALEESQK